VLEARSIFAANTLFFVCFFVEINYCESFTNHSARVGCLFIVLIQVYDVSFFLPSSTPSLSRLSSLLSAPAADDELMSTFIRQKQKHKCKYNAR